MLECWPHKWSCGDAGGSDKGLTATEAAEGIALPRAGVLFLFLGLQGGAEKVRTVVGTSLPQLGCHLWSQEDQPALEPLPGHNWREGNTNSTHQQSIRVGQRVTAVGMASAFFFKESGELL